MADNLRVALTTTLNERLVAPLRRSLGEVERNLRSTERNLRGVSTAARDADRAMLGIRGPERAAREVSLLARTTENAVTLAQRLQTVWTRTGSLMRGIGAGIAAGQAARYVVSAPLQTERTYGRMLADAANVAYADRDLAGRQTGMGEVDALVVRALKEGGGKRPAVLTALMDMLASGTVNIKDAGTDLPILAKYATAGSADIEALSAIAVRGRQNGLDDITRTLDMALAAGQAGGFELRDMATWIPKLLAAGRPSGIQGYEGYARILASAQGGIITAGSRDEAGNNLLNLLLKINAPDTANDAKKLGIDLPGSLAAAQARGVNALDAFINLIEQIAGKDQRLIKLRQQASAASTDEDKRASLQAQADILQGSAVGKIVQDRQALMQLVAEINKREYIQGVQKTVLGAAGQYGSTNFDLVSTTNDFKISQQENEALIAQTRALSDVNKTLGALAETTTDLYRRYPGFASAVEAAKLTVWSLAAAAGTAAGALALLGFAKAGSTAGGAVVGAASGAAGSLVRPLGSHLAGPLPATAPAAVAASGSFTLPIAATAGAAAVAGAIPFAMGAWLQHRMTGTESGLRSRIADRNDRLSELNQLISLEAEGGAQPAALARLELERNTLLQDRDALVRKLDEMIRVLQAQSERPIEMHVDGQQLQATVNDRNGRDARRE